jgi:hypothetical protein
MKFAHTKVLTIDSNAYPGWPQKIEVNGNMVEVEEVVDRWVSAYKDPSFYPNEYFKVRISDGKVYILMYNTLFNSWWIKEFEL